MPYCVARPFGAAVVEGAGVGAGAGLGEPAADVVVLGCTDGIAAEGEVIDTAGGSAVGAGTPEDGGC